MKPLTFLAVALLFAASGCSKKSSNNNPSTPLGTLTFTANGKVYTWAATGDTITQSITATGIFPGTTDSGKIAFDLYTASLSAAHGVFSDTASLTGNYSMFPSFWDIGDEWTDYPVGNINGVRPNACVLDITSNNGGIVAGTFSGMFYEQASGVDSLLLTKGSFAIKL